MKATAIRSPKNSQLSAGLANIERLAAEYASRRNTLSEKVSLLDEEVRDIRRKRIGAIREAVAAVRDVRAELQAAIELSKAEFERPRTRTFHGIKVGFRKLVGKLTWDNAEQVIKLIKKHFADRKDLLIKTTETPVKGALEQLTGEELKKIGCSLGKDTDEVVISDAGSEIDRIVDALLKEEPESTDQTERKAS